MMRDIQEFIEKDKKRFSHERDLATYNYSTKPLSSALPYSVMPKIRNSERVERPPQVYQKDSLLNTIYIFERIL